MSRHADVQRKYCVTSPDLCQAFVENEAIIFCICFCAWVAGYDEAMETGSYMMIVPGMTVRGTDGDLGTVAEVVADAGVDVFRGIVLVHGFLSTNWHSCRRKMWSVWNKILCMSVFPKVRPNSFRPRSPAGRPMKEGTNYYEDSKRNDDT